VLYLLSGLAVCAVCGAAMVSGTDNANGHRKTPWQFNVFGRKKLEGWSARPSPKIGAEGPDRAVLEVVNERVLTTDFIDTLVPEVNRQSAENTSQCPLLAILVWSQPMG